MFIQQPQSSAWNGNVHQAPFLHFNGKNRDLSNIISSFSMGAYSVIASLLRMGVLADGALFLCVQEREKRKVSNITGLAPLAVFC